MNEDVWDGEMVDKNLYKSRQEKGIYTNRNTNTAIGHKKYFWNRLQTTEAILPPPVNPPISVQLGAVQVSLVLNIFWKQIICIFYNLVFFYFPNKMAT